jgi:hypothetical protein
MLGSQEKAGTAAYQQRTPSTAHRAFSSTADNLNVVDFEDLPGDVVDSTRETCRGQETQIFHHLRRATESFTLSLEKRYSKLRGK